METRWHSERHDEKPVVRRVVGSGIIVAWAVLALPAVGLAMSALARQAGVVIGIALGVILRQLFSALGVFARHGFLEPRRLAQLYPGQGLALWSAAVIGRRVRRGSPRR